MPGKGRPWDRERAKFKADCQARNAGCWNCILDHAPIDYISRYDPKRYNPYLFSVDEVIPSSLGGDPLRTAMWKPAHLKCNTSRGNTTRGQFPTSRAW